MTAEQIPVALHRLVLWSPDSERSVASVDELLAQEVSYVLCNPAAGVGRKTKRLLGEQYPAVAAAAWVTKPTVNDGERCEGLRHR